MYIVYFLCFGKGARKTGVSLGWCGYGLGNSPVDPYPHGNLWCFYGLGAHGGGMTAMPSLFGDEIM